MKLTSLRFMQGLIGFKGPATGRAPKFIKHVLGRKAKIEIRKGELISFKAVC